MGRGKYEDLTGTWFGEIEVLNRAPREQGGRPKWVCRCGCGKIFIAQARYLKSGHTKSCGCSVKRAREDNMYKYEARKNSESLDVLELSLDRGDPYKNLANAIVAVAADDYRTSLKNNNQKLKTSLEEFFHSNWYNVLTNLDGDRLITALQNEHSMATAQ